MSFFRRVFGRAGQGEEPPADPGELVPAALDPEPVEAMPAPPLPTCPSCGYTLDPPPDRSRHCPSCRQPIIVRRVDGRAVLLVESAVPIFDRERQRIVDEQIWTAERDRWLELAETVRAPAARRAKLATAELSAATVEASHSLYVSGAETAVRRARRAKRWPEVARILRHQAAALYHAAGSPVPPPDEVVALHREGMLAELRALAIDYTDAELVGPGCCRACRANDGNAFRIAAELREPRLPHVGCPKGLCACEWWLAMPAPKKRRRTPRPKVQIPAPEVDPGPADGAEAVDPGRSDG